MLQVKYYKDYRHNYLIVKDGESFSENVYQRKMITENKIAGLLPVSKKHINGELLFYYEITSKQSFQSLFGEQSIKMKHLKKFFLQLKLVNDTLQKYLLDGNCLVLLPEYIFQNLETEELFFLYYPEPELGSLGELMDFFMEKVDNEDMEAVEAVYKIADLIHKEQFVLDEVLKWFQEDMEAKEAAVSKEPVLPEEQWQEVEEEKESDSDRKLLGLFVPMGLAAMGAAALITVMLKFELSYRETIYLVLGWCLAAAVAAASVIRYVKAEFFPKFQNKKTEAETLARQGQFMPTYEEENNVVSQDMGNTVFIPWAENCEHKLYGADRKNKCHIDLAKLPLTVGKLAGAVDVVINEQSLSRMHARFSKSGSSVYVTDLNSTNGTFKNGMRLEPNASEMIEPGDEIKLGKLKFIYR